jgi:hypothetical protein
VFGVLFCNLFVLESTLNCHADDFIFALHLLKFDLLFIFCQFDEDVAGDEGEGNTLITVATGSAHSMNIGC